ncbi:histidine phosphatase family protein [Octadecabacter sp.]|nr:histidine phosphatase family protein [Octadecabacter sp.]
MTKRLILIRHAKSSWDAPFDDHARTLNDRGRATATAIGDWLASKDYSPNTVYTSDAARTLETTDRIISALRNAPTVHPVPQMYHGAPATLLSVLQRAEGDTVMLVAHNPGIAFFAEDIVSQAPKHGRFLDYPTCATLVCDFPINKWADAVSRSAQVVDFIVPKDLDV